MEVLSWYQHLCLALCICPDQFDCGCHTCHMMGIEIGACGLVFCFCSCTCCDLHPCLCSRPCPFHHLWEQSPCKHTPLRLCALHIEHCLVCESHNKFLSRVMFQVVQKVTGHTSGLTLASAAKNKDLRVTPQIPNKQQQVLTSLKACYPLVWKFTVIG